MLHSKNDSRELAVANFSLYPMSDHFVEIIGDALAETDTSKVSMETDDVSTTTHGKIAHVFNVTNAICVHAAKTGKHVALQATYASGCHGYTHSDANTLLEEDDIPSNHIDDEENNLYAAAKFAIYPLGGGDYMELILQQIELMKEFVTVTPSTASTKITGGLIDIFKGLEKVFQQIVYKGSSHTVMTVNLSINSPSHEANKNLSQ